MSSVGQMNVNNDYNMEVSPEDFRANLLREAKMAVEDAEALLDDIPDDLIEAKNVAALAGLKTDTHIVEKTADGETANALTGGFSNTDHIVANTGDKRSDRIAELKRGLLRRSRAMVPETRRDERWDRPKAPGERRRKIVLEKDQDDSPPEPPRSGWNIYMGQMTAKYRHDTPDKHHSQAEALKVISALWKNKLTEDEKEYYQEFATEAREMYQQQVIEYRATGSYTISDHFRPLDDTNIWVRLDQPCALEKEIMGYETVKFAPRPPELDEAYEDRIARSVVKRKLKNKKQWNEEDDEPEEGIDFEELVEEEKRRPKKKRKRQPQKTGGGGLPAKLPATSAPLTKAKAPPIPAPALEWEGPPTEELEGGWPEGWRKQLCVRVGGKNEGKHDKYWITPIEKYRLRSIVEVKAFMEALNKNNGDEKLARQASMKKRPPRQKPQSGSVQSDSGNESAANPGPNKEVLLEEASAPPAKAKASPLKPTTTTTTLEPPPEELEGGWPQGWRKEVHVRKNGKDKGREDRFWITPIEKYKLRSIMEARAFIEALGRNNGDEKLARQAAVKKRPTWKPPQSVNAQSDSGNESADTPGPMGEMVENKAPPKAPALKPAILEWEGPPPEEFEGGWPQGWRKRVYVRQGGTWAGTKDRFWVTPIEHYKLRSIKEVKAFMEALEKNKGDEKLARQAIQQRKKAKVEPSEQQTLSAPGQSGSDSGGNEDSPPGDTSTNPLEANLDLPPSIPQRGMQQLQEPPKIYYL